MAKKESNTIVFVLRIWMGPLDNGGSTVWRCIVEDPHSKARRGFTTLESLLAFLASSSNKWPLDDNTNRSAR